MAGVQPGLWAVHGGNKQIAHKLLQRSEVKVINAEVTRVILKPGNQFEVEIDSKSATNYNIVIVATPLHEGLSKIKFGNFPEPLENFPKSFEHITANFIEGQINVTKFGFSSEAEFPKALLMTETDLFYNSVGKQYPVDYVSSESEAFETKTKVWKVFSERPLGDKELDELFSSKDSVKHVEHLAYPHYSSTAENIPTTPESLLHQRYRMGCFCTGNVSHWRTQCGPTGLP